MDENSIDRIRSATFTIGRRGYETREVEQFLNKIADWLEGGGEDKARAETVRRELERIGQRTSEILLSAEGSADQLRADAATEAAQTVDGARVDAARARENAGEYAEKTRRDADAYAAKVRSEADQYSATTVAAAEQKATRIVDDGIRRRGDIETVISDLVERRDALIADADRAAGELRGVAARHAPEKGADEFARPAELDPQERVEAGS